MSPANRCCSVVFGFLLAFGVGCTGAPQYGPHAMDVTGQGVAAFLATSSSPLLAAIVATPDVSISAPTQVLASRACSPVAAFDGANFLVVTCEARTGGYWDVVAMRVTPAGVLLDLAGFPVSAEVGDQLYPDVSFNGQDFVVAWMDSRGGDRYAIYAARVSSAGRVLDPGGILVNAGGPNLNQPRVSSDGTSTLIVWTTGLDIRGARLDRAGKVLDANGIDIASSAEPEIDPAVAFNGSTYLVAWTRHASPRLVEASRVTPGGMVLDRPSIRVTGENLQGFEPCVASDGTDFFVGWKQLPSNYLAPPIPSRTIVSGAGIPGSTEGYAAATTWRLAAAFDGSSYFLVLDNQVYRFAPDGRVLGGPNQSWATPWMTPSIASGGGARLSTWLHRSADQQWNVWASRLAADGSMQDFGGIQLTSSLAWSSERFGASAFDGTNHLVVWADDRAGQLDIYGARITRSGEPIDTDAIAISTTAGDQANPFVLFDGTKYFVVWADLRSGTNWEVYARAVGVDGVPDPFEVAVSTGPHGVGVVPSAAFDGTNYLVTWSDPRNGNRDIYAARVSRQLQVIDPGGTPVTAVLGAQVDPRVAFDGTNYLVVWTDQRSGDLDLYSTRVNKNGGALDPAGVPVAVGAGSQDQVDVLFDGTQFVAAWSDTRSGVPQVRAARISRTGISLDPEAIAVSTSLDGATAPRLQLDGKQVVITYRELPTGDLLLAAIDQAGTVRSLGRAASDAYPWSRLAPSFAEDGTGIIGFARQDSLLGSPRARTQGIVTWYPLEVSRSGTGVGTVTGPATGIDCGAACQAKVEPGESDALSAVPDAGSRFAGWSGACSGTGVCRVTMDAPKSVVAAFEEITHVVSFTASGSGSGLVTSDFGSAHCDSTCAVSIPEGTRLLLTASPSPGSAFVGWSGACSGTGPCSLVIAGPVSVYARFEALRSLAVSKIGTGTGTVSGGGGAISCGATCSAELLHGTEVTLTALAGAGSRFVGWSGACSGTAACTLTMEAALQVAAEFEGLLQAITIHRSGAGTVLATPGGVVCGDNCVGQYLVGERVTLAAVPDAGQRFAGWTGACSGLGVCTITVSGPATVGATFDPALANLRVVRLGTGAGSVAGAAGDISCGATCSADLATGAAVTLTATPESGSTFGGWSGDCSGTGTCQVTLSTSRVVEARFDLLPAPAQSGCGCGYGGSALGVESLLAAVVLAIARSGRSRARPERLGLGA